MVKILVEIPLGAGGLRCNELGRRCPFISLYPGVGNNPPGHCVVFRQPLQPGYVMKNQQAHFGDETPLTCVPQCILARVRERVVYDQL